MSRPTRPGRRGRLAAAAATMPLLLLPAGAASAAPGPEAIEEAGPRPPALVRTEASLPSAAFRFAETSAASLRAAGWWSGESRASRLGRDATRRELVRMLAALGGLPAGAAGTAWADVAADDPDGLAAQEANRRGWLPLQGGLAALDLPVTPRVAQRAVALALGFDRALFMLSRLSDGTGRRLRLPVGFAASVVAREAGLRHNYYSPDDVQERPDWAPMRLADFLYLVDGARVLKTRGAPAPVRALETIRLPAIPEDMVPLVERALGQVGQPYVWGGEWPTTASPLDRQAAGGFDCSGLVWYAYRTGDRNVEAASFSIPDGRTTYTMAGGRRGRRIPASQAGPGDAVFFGDAGRRTPNNAVSHMGMSLGNGWIVQSSGSRGGVTVSWLRTYWWSGVQAARTYRATTGTVPVPVSAPVTPVDPTTPTTPVDPAVPATDPVAVPATPVTVPVAPPSTSASVQPPPPAG